MGHPPPPARAVAVAALLACAYAAVYGATCLLKYRYYLYCDFDLAIFAQATSGILRGSFFSSIRGMPWLGDHVSLILFLVAPLFAVFRDPRTLLVVQTLALASGALPVHRLAYRETGRAGAALAFAALYLLYPALGYVNLYEFHPEALAVPFLLFAFVFAREGRSRAAVTCACLAMLAREDVALPVLALAGYAWLSSFPNGRRTAVPLATAGAVSLILSFVLVLPSLNAGQATYARVYAEWGRTTGEALVNMLTQPHRVVAYLFWVPGDLAHTTAKLQLWLHLLLPLAFLPVWAPGTLAIALPTLFEHLLSWRTPQHSISYQYMTLVVPWFVVAAVMGYAGWARRASASVVTRAAPWVAMVCAIASQVLFGPLWGLGVWQNLKPFEQVWPTATDRARSAVLDSVVARVPAEGGVVAGFELLSRFATRSNVHSLHHVLLGRYTFSNASYPMPRGIVAVAGDMGHRTLLGSVNATTGARMRELFASNDLHPVFADGEIVLWARGARDTVELLSAGAPTMPLATPVRFDDALECVGADSLPVAIGAGETLRLRLGWRRVAPVRRLFPVRIELIDAAGVTVSAERHSIGYTVWPFHDWPADTTRLETLRIPLPRRLAPGTYAVAVSIVASPLPGAAPASELASRALLGRLNVVAR